MNQVLIVYAAGWVACAVAGLVLESIRLNTPQPAPRWLDVTLCFCAVWLLGPLAIVAAPIWLGQRRTKPKGP